MHGNCSMWDFHVAGNFQVTHPVLSIRYACNVRVSCSPTLGAESSYKSVRLEEHTRECTSACEGAKHVY